MKQPTQYYLQNCTNGYLGNSPYFWAEKGGYTQWLDDAKKWTKEEARNVIRSTKGSHRWKMWAVKRVDKVAKRTVDMQDLYRTIRRKPVPKPILPTIHCDNPVGPCACGAWHSTGSNGAVS
jgi:hypothetical protein